MASIFTIEKWHFSREPVTSIVWYRNILISFMYMLNNGEKKNVKKEDKID